MYWGNSGDRLSSVSETLTQTSMMMSTADKENPGASAGSGVGTKRGLQARGSGGSVDTGVNCAASKKAKKKSGIPVPRAGTASAAKKKRPRTPAAAPASDLADQGAGNGIADALTSHRELLDTLLAAVRNKPDTKGMSKTAYKSRMLAFEKGYKTLRTAAGEYQKTARTLLDQIAAVEKQLADENRRSNAETNQLRSACESLKQQVQELKDSLATLRVERSQLETEGSTLKATVTSLKSSVSTLESQVLEHKGANATLTATVAALQTRADEATKRVEASEQQHREDLERVQRELSERHEIKVAAVSTRCADLQQSLEAVRGELSVSKAAALDAAAKLEAAQASLSATKAQLDAKSAQLQDHAIADVKNEAQIAHLTSNLASKEREMERAVESMRQTQQMSERRAEELSAEKKVLVTKVDALEASRREAEAIATELREKINTVTRDLEGKTERVEALVTSEAALQQQLAQQTARASVAEERASSFEEKFCSTKDALDTCASEKAALDTAYATLQVSSKADKERLEAEVSKWSSRAQTAETGLTAAQKQCSDLEMEKHVLQGAAGSSAQEQLEKVMKLTVENDALKKGSVPTRVSIFLESPRSACVSSRSASSRAMGSGARSTTRCRSCAAMSVWLCVSDHSWAVKWRLRIQHSLPAVPSSVVVMQTAWISRSSLDQGLGKIFRLDKVFGPQSDQSKVFEEVSELVQSAFDGFNACIYIWSDRILERLTRCRVVQRVTHVESSRAPSSKSSTLRRV